MLSVVVVDSQSHMSWYGFVIIVVLLYYAWWMWAFILRAIFGRNRGR